MNRYEQQRQLVMIALVFGLFDYELAQFLLKSCVEYED